MDSRSGSDSEISLIKRDFAVLNDISPPTVTDCHMNVRQSDMLRVTYFK